MIAIIGDSHSALVFRAATIARGLEVTQDSAQGSLVIIAQDMPTDETGKIDDGPIVQLVYEALRATSVAPKPVVIFSQIPIGFTRKFQTDRLYCYSQTLRVIDAYKRAMYPEQIVVGCMKPSEELPGQLFDYLHRFCDKVIQCSYEEAEFARMAINVTLAHQVTLANVMAEKARSCGCSYEVVKRIMQNDKRIGTDAYLDPGDWRKSINLLRDYVAFHETR